MKCPICGKEVELQNKQVGTDASGTPVFHEYAVCRDCKKQWDLDKQRAKKRAEKANASAQKKTGTPEKPVENPAERPVDPAHKKMQFLLRKKAVPMRKKQFPQNHLQKQ